MKFPNKEFYLKFLESVTIALIDHVGDKDEYGHYNTIPGKDFSGSTVYYNLKNVKDCIEDNQQ